MISTISISTIIRISLMVLFVLSLFGIAGLLNPWVEMTPEQIWPGFQFWRLATWPIAVNFGIIVGAIAFSQPGEEIETMLGKTRFGIALLLVTLIVALLHLLCFWKAPVPVLAGSQNIGLFVMVGYVYLFPDSSVRIFFFNVRSKILLLVMSLFPIAGTAFAVSEGESIFVLFGLGGGGLMLGALWFHIVYQKYPVLLGPLRFFTHSKNSGPRKVAPVRARAVARRKVSLPVEDRIRPISDEERLDAILEQISNRGYESLNSDDRKFLEEYSSRL